MIKKTVHEKQKNKNYAVFFALAAFVVVVFFVTIVKLKGA